MTYILRQFNDRFEDISSTDSVMRSVSSSSKIHMSLCLFECMYVCESVRLSQTHIVLDLIHNFFRQTSPSQKNPNWSLQRKYEGVIMDHPGNSGGEHVCPVFQEL